MIHPIYLDLSKDTVSCPAILAYRYYILGRGKICKPVGRIDPLPPVQAELLKIDDGNSTNPRVSISLIVGTLKKPHIHGG